MIMDDKWGYPHLWKHPNDKAWEKSALTQVFFYESTGTGSIWCQGWPLQGDRWWCNDPLRNPRRWMVLHLWDFHIFQDFLHDTFLRWDPLAEETPIPRLPYYSHKKPQDGKSMGGPHKFYGHACWNVFIFHQVAGKTALGRRCNI